MSAERPRRREFSQSVSDHLFRHEHLQMDLPVVNHERMAHELRDDRAGPGPSLDRILSPRVVLLLNLQKQLGIDKGTFLQ